MAVPFAFSIHQFVSSVGADAGFASIVGLAILILLYFAQARETATLRDHAYEANQRVAQLEARLEQYARQAQARPGTPAATAPATAAATVAASAGGSARAAAHAVLAYAPAGVGAPALAAATRVVPAGVAPAAAQAVAANGAGPPAPPAPVAAPPQPVAAPAHAAAVPPQAVRVAPQSAVASPPTGALPPATVAGGSNGHDRVAPPPAGVRTAQTQPPRRPALSPEAQVQAARAAMAARPARGGPWRRVLPVAIAVVVIAGGVVAYLKLHHSGSPTPAASNTLPAAAGSSSARPVTPAAVVKPSSVTVAVLNGTATTGLAHRTAQRLAAAGYREGTVATASDQTHTTTVVAYLAGHRIDAVAVARALKLRLASVQLVDAATKAVACPPPAACTADVVVTVGTDLASQ